MRRLSQSAFLAAVVLLAALPHLLADNAKPVPVQLDVAVFTCSPQALAETKLANAGPARFMCVNTTERNALLEKVRADKRTKCLAAPKIVAMSARPCQRLGGGQTPDASSQVD